MGRLLVAECLSEECFRRRRFDGGAANAAEILSGPGATPLPLLELPLGDGNLLLLTKAEQPGQLRLIVHHEAFEAVAEIPLRGSEGRLLAFEGEDMAALNLTACIAEAVASIPARRDSTRH
ncbi:hypothetical protein [Telmatospirillum sp. J64-1]|uniref:hypothetical protein n=1 Tax=Telmatospirillum sp. J64-1 TaxID=2502183 RepID=UPI00115DC488|nr:hypothetical protein [Telmatospirillum sp. J64-1]